MNEQVQVGPERSILVGEYSCKLVLSEAFLRMNTSANVSLMKNSCKMNTRDTATFQHSSDEHTLVLRSITDYIHNIFVFTKDR